MHELLRKPAADEVVRSYNDVLRTGRILVDGEAVEWDTDTTTELQLQNFCEVFWERLRGMEKMTRCDGDTLHELAYWFCKAVSISYLPLMDLLREVGATCVGKTDEADAPLLQYSLDVQNDTEPLAVAKLEWLGAGGNLLTVDPMSGNREVKGQLRQLHTSFPVPVSQGYRPTYEFDLQFPAPARKAGLISKLMTRRRVRVRPQGVTLSSDERFLRGGPTTVQLLAEHRLSSEHVATSFRTLSMSSVDAEDASSQADVCDPGLIDESAVPQAVAPLGSFTSIIDDVSSSRTSSTTACSGYRKPRRSLKGSRVGCARLSTAAAMGSRTLNDASTRKRFFRALGLSRFSTFANFRRWRWRRFHRGALSGESQEALQTPPSWQLALTDQDRQSCRRSFSRSSSSSCSNTKGKMAWTEESATL